MAKFNPTTLGSFHNQPANSHIPLAMIITQTLSGYMFNAVIDAPIINPTVPIQASA
jgi:hypothetical protein